MHWGYVGFILPLIIIVELIWELKRKRPTHIGNGEHEKGNTNRQSEQAKEGG